MARKLSQITETVQYKGEEWKVDTRYVDDNGTPMVLIRRRIDRARWLDLGVPESTVSR